MKKIGDSTVIGLSLTVAKAKAGGSCDGCYLKKFKYLCSELRDMGLLDPCDSAERDDKEDVIYINLEEDAKWKF